MENSSYGCNVGVDVVVKEEAGTVNKPLVANCNDGISSRGKGGKSHCKNGNSRSKQEMAVQIKQLQAQLKQHKSDSSKNKNSSCSNNGSPIHASSANGGLSPSASSLQRIPPPPLNIESKNGDLPIESQHSPSLGGAHDSNNTCSGNGGLQSRLEFHSKVEWAPAYQRNNKANGQKNLRCFPAHCEGLGHQRGFCGRSIVVNFYCNPSEITGPLVSFGQFTIADCELGSQAGITAKGASRDRFNVGDLLPYDHVKNNIRSSEAPLLEYVQGLELQDRRMDADGSVRINFEFNRNLKGWHYGFLGSKLTRNLHHIFRVYVLEEVPASATMPHHYKVHALCTSPDWTLFCRRRNRASIPTAEEIKEQQRKALLEQKNNFLKQQTQQHGGGPATRGQHHFFPNHTSEHTTNRLLHLPPPSASLKSACLGSPSQLLDQKLCGGPNLPDRRSPANSLSTVDNQGSGRPALKKRRDTQPPSRGGRSGAGNHQRGMHGTRRNTTPRESGVSAQLRAELGLSANVGPYETSPNLTSFGSFRGASVAFTSIPMFDSRSYNNSNNSSDPLFRGGGSEGELKQYMRRQQSMERLRPSGRSHVQKKRGSSDIDEGAYYNSGGSGSSYAPNYPVHRNYCGNNTNSGNDSPYSQGGPGHGGHYYGSGNQHQSHISHHYQQHQFSPSSSSSVRGDAVDYSILAALEGLAIPFSEEAMGGSCVRPLKAGGENACSSSIASMVKTVCALFKDTASLSTQPYVRDRNGLTSYLLTQKSFFNAVKKYGADNEGILDDDIYGNLSFFTNLLKKELKAFFQVSANGNSSTSSTSSNNNVAAASSTSLSAMLSSAPSFASLGLSITPTSKSKGSVRNASFMTSNNSTNEAANAATAGLNQKMSSLGLLARRFSAKFSAYNMSVDGETLTKTNSLFNLNSFRIPSNVNILSFETNIGTETQAGGDDLEAFLSKHSTMVDDEN